MLFRFLVFFKSLAFLFLPFQFCYSASTQSSPKCSMHSNKIIIQKRHKWTKCWDAFAAGPLLRFSSLGFAPEPEAMGRVRRYGHCSEHGKHFTRHRSAVKFITSPSEETRGRRQRGFCPNKHHPDREREREAGGCVHPSALTTAAI